MQLCKDLTILTPHRQFYKDLPCQGQEVDENSSDESDEEELLFPEMLILRLTLSE